MHLSCDLGSCTDPCKDMPLIWCLPFALSYFKDFALCMSNVCAQHCECISSAILSPRNQCKAHMVLPLPLVPCFHIDSNSLRLSICRASEIVSSFVKLNRCTYAELASWPHSKSSDCYASLCKSKIALRQTSFRPKKGLALVRANRTPTKWMQSHECHSVGPSYAAPGPHLLRQYPVAELAAAISDTQWLGGRLHETW